MKGLTVFEGMFGGDSMHHLNVDGDDEPIRFDDQVVVFHEPAFVVVELPGQLHQSRPVVEVGERRVILFRETGGLGIEY